MPPSFRNRFRRRDNNNNPNGGDANGIAGGVVGSGVGRFLAGRSTSNSSSRASSDSSSRGSLSRRSYPGVGSPRRSNQERHPPLATFDACIEACDALAASSGQRTSIDGSVENTNAVALPSSTSVEDQESNNDIIDNSSSAYHCEEGEEEVSNSTTKSSTRNEQEEIVADCSVLVSPDGALLFTRSGTSNTKNNNNNNNQDESSSSLPDNKYPWTKISTENRDGVILEEEYASAIICGNDLTPNGDADSNGFSGRGWNPDAATLALGVGRDVLTIMEQFVEELATTQKEEGMRINESVNQVSQFRGRYERNQFRRVGPILCKGSKLLDAMEAMEEYYASVSMGDLDRWRVACGGQGRQAGVSSTEHSTASIEMKEMNQSNGKALINGLLPKLHKACEKASNRTSQRERAISSIRSKLTDAQTVLQSQKQWAASQWRKVYDEECNIDRLYAIKKMEQHEFYENHRQQQQEGAVMGSMGELEGEGPLSEEVWEMVQGVASMEEFGHTGYSPRSLRKNIKMSDLGNSDGRKSTSRDGLVASELALQQHSQHHQHVQTQQQHTIPPRSITRADVERESEIHDLRMVAQAADESVEDAAGKLLNLMSKADTTMRSARLAAESCLLSECNAVEGTLKSLVAMERATLEDRLRRLDVLEAAVSTIDSRSDIDAYISADKSTPGGRSRTGGDDDGGIAAALAVLNSHAEAGGGSEARLHPHIERPSYFEGWGDHDDGRSGEAEDYDDSVDPELFGDIITMLFDGSGGGPDQGQEISQPESIKATVERASIALSEKTAQGQSFRKAVLYELNNQRSKQTQVNDKTNFDSLCQMFNAFLSGCGREAIDVSNAKMLMILSQTFYFVDEMQESDANATEAEEAGTTRDRNSRIYVKSQISNLPIWKDEDFWDQAVYQCVSESLAKSGVLMNCIKSSDDRSKNAVDHDPPKSVKWHDLSPDEYAGAAAQVHSVVFAQLGTLSREFG